LLIKNLRTKRLNKGLNHVKVRPFLILDQKGLVTYTLNLLLDAKIYLRFYVNMLELVDLETLLQKTFYFETEEDNIFKVEKILAHRTKGNSKEYLIK
jgi:hypothetical protein